MSLHAVLIKLALLGNEQEEEEEQEEPVAAAAALAFCFGRNGGSNTIKNCDNKPHPNMNAV